MPSRPTLPHVRAYSARLRRGFTIVELLVVFLVLAILASIALVRYRNMKERAYIAQIQTDMAQLRVAEEGYWSEHQIYTVDTAQLDFNGSSDVHVTVTSSDLHAGFDATGTHKAVPAIVCQMYIGRVVGSTPSGEIKCH